MESTTTKTKNHVVFLKSRKAVCPICGGLIRVINSEDIILNCIDCGVYFRAIGHGHADAELECEEVTIGE